MSEKKHQQCYKGKKKNNHDLYLEIRFVGVMVYSFNCIPGEYRQRILTEKVMILIEKVVMWQCKSTTTLKIAQKR